MSGQPSPGFDYALLLAHLGELATRFDVEHQASCPSTNTELLRRADAPAGSVLICDEQTAGRGRRGRRWTSAAGHSLTFSLRWRLPPGCASSGLSLAVGVAVAQALEILGVPAIGLKWPNDIWLYGRKLGGVLVEATPERKNPAFVIGIGLNLSRPADWPEYLAATSASLDETGLGISREVLLAALLRQLHVCLGRFGEQGFGALSGAWNAHNALLGLPVTLSADHRQLRGLCGTVNTEGALRLIDAEGVPHLITGGDLSLRLDSGAA